MLGRVLISSGRFVDACSEDYEGKSDYQTKDGALFGEHFIFYFLCDFCDSDMGVVILPQF
jgi:hypothetical protein